MNCDGIARWYRALEYMAFGRALMRRRLEYIDQILQARRVLILGDGDGRFTAEFVKRNPRAEVDSIDLSAKMIEMARVRVGSAPNVRFHVADARTISFEKNYDLVVTHFFLDCFLDRELEKLLARVVAQCGPGARWLVSDFALPKASAGRWAAKLLIRFMYFCFWLTTGLTVTQLPDYANAFARNGLRLVSRATKLGGLLVSEIWTL